MAATASWSAAEDKVLRDCCAAAPPGPAGYDAIDWDRVAAQVGGRRSGAMCRDRWAALHVPSGKAPRAPKGAAGPWTPEEDAAIVECLHGGMTKVPSVNTHPARTSLRPLTHPHRAVYPPRAVVGDRGQVGDRPHRQAGPGTLEQPPRPVAEKRPVDRRGRRTHVRGTSAPGQHVEGDQHRHQVHRW